MSNRKRPRGRPSKYPPEFQRDALAVVLDEQRSIADVARSIGVNEGTLGNWVAKARRERSVGVFDASDGNYGVPRKHGELRRCGVSVNEKRVRRLMRLHGMAGRCRRRRCQTTFPVPTDT